MIVETDGGDEPSGKVLVNTNYDSSSLVLVSTVGERLELFRLRRIT